MKVQLTLEDTAPDFRFDAPWKQGLQFYRQIEGKPAVLVFLRYLGCPVCQMEMANFKNSFNLFKNKGAGLFVAIQSPPSTVARVTGPKDWPFTIICDPESKIFKLYGVEPGGIIKYLHPAGLIAAVKATVKGYRHGKFEGRETQLPAAFVISSEKKIRFAYYGKTLSDVPAPSTLAANI